MESETKLRKEELPTNSIAFQWLFSSYGHENVTKALLKDMLGDDNIAMMD